MPQKREHYVKQAKAIQTNMKYLSRIASVITLTIVISLPSLVSAQVLADAIEKYNEGLEFAQNRDFANAIVTFKEAIEMSNAVGAEADDIRNRAMTQIPRMSLQIAAGYLRERDFENGIEALKDTRELAEKYNDEETARRALGNLPRAYLQLGNILYREGEIDAAAQQYRSALEIYPNYHNAYYQLGLVYRVRQDLEESLRNFDRAIELADSQNDADGANRARMAAHDYLVFVGARQIEDKQYRRSVETLRRALGYNPESAEAHYRLAEAFNFQAQWDNAIESALRALQFDNSPRTEQARIHFELGVAHKNRGNEQAACNAFENAAFGDFRAAAEHELEHELNCN